LASRQIASVARLARRLQTFGSRPKGWAYRKTNFAASLKTPAGLPGSERPPVPAASLLQKYSYPARKTRTRHNQKAPHSTHTIDQSRLLIHIPIP